MSRHFPFRVLEHPTATEVKVSAGVVDDCLFVDDVLLHVEVVLQRHFLPAFVFVVKDIIDVLARPNGLQLGLDHPLVLDSFSLGELVSMKPETDFVIHGWGRIVFVFFYQLHTVGTGRDQTVEVAVFVMCQKTPSRNQCPKSFWALGGMK